MARALPSATRVVTTSILIVEDDEQLRSAVARDLSRRGFDVVTVSCVDGALAHFEDRSFDVVLTDLRMEGADGIDLLAALGRVAPGTRPILMSAFASARDHQRAIQLGAVQVLCKPFTPAELMRAIQQAIECESGFRGRVHGLSLVDVLQMFHYGRRSLSVYLGANPRGEIHVQDGEIIHARHGESVGESALRTILAMPSGSIETVPLDGEEASITRPFQLLLLDVLRELDEEKKVDDPFGGFDGAFMPFEPRTPSIAPVSSMDASCVCAELAARVEGTVVCAAVDLDARALLGLHDSLGFLGERPDFLVDDTVDLFESASLAEIDEQLESVSEVEKARGLQEVRVLSSHACRLAVSLPGGRRVVVLVTCRETNPALAFWHLKATIPRFERVLP
jgi:CheY-like chemotaxis protein